MLGFLKKLFSIGNVEEGIEEDLFKFLIEDMNNIKHTKIFDKSEKSFVLTRGKRLIFKVNTSNWELIYPKTNKTRMNKKQIKVFKKTMRGRK